MNFDFESWPRAGSGPHVSAGIKVRPEDFQVQELLGFELTGEGEFLLLEIEKNGANTDWVARQLARRIGVAARAVSYSGLKDRHAVTRQFFSVHLPGKPDPELAMLDIPGVAILQSQRHRRKLRRGSHKGNRFRIHLRGLDGDRGRLVEQLKRVRREGVPNYFGPQRFGYGGANLERAQSHYAGSAEHRDRRVTGLLHSAARAFLFNEVLAQRVRRRDWDTGADGDIWMLDGSRSVFGPEILTEELMRRAAAGDIHPTGPLWGAGESPAGGGVAQLERGVAQDHQGLSDGLFALGLRQERRRLRMLAPDLDWEQGDEGMWLGFTLGRGEFATALLREIVAPIEGG